VKLEDFETVIDMQPLIDVLETADDDGGDESDGGCAPDRYVTSRGSDS